MITLTFTEREINVLYSMLMWNMECEKLGVTNQEFDDIQIKIGECVTQRGFPDPDDDI